MAKVQIKSEKLTPFGGIFQSWSVYVIGDKIAYIENSDGNTNVRFHQAETHKRFFSLMDSKNIHVNRFRADCGSCSKEIVSEIEKHCKHFQSYKT